MGRSLCQTEEAGCSMYDHYSATTMTSNAVVNANLGRQYIKRFLKEATCVPISR